MQYTWCSAFYHVKYNQQQISIDLYREVIISYRYGTYQLWEQYDRGMCSNQGRIQDLKLWVAQMDWRIWKPGGNLDKLENMIIMI